MFEAPRRSTEAPGNRETKGAANTGREVLPSVIAERQPSSVAWPLISRRTLSGIPQQPQELVKWMQGILSEGADAQGDQACRRLIRRLNSKLELLASYYQHKKTELAVTEKQIAEFRQRKGEIPPGIRFLPRRAFLQHRIYQLERLGEAFKAAVTILDHAYSQDRTDLIREFLSVKRAADGPARELSESLRAAKASIESLCRYHQLATKIILTAKSGMYREAGLVHKLEAFRYRILPSAIQSSLPIATGLLTYHFISGGFSHQAGLISSAALLVCSGLAAGVTAAGLALRKFRSGGFTAEEIKIALGSTIKSLSLGLSLQTLVLCQHYLSRAGLTFSTDLKHLLFYSVLGGVIDSVISYFVDVGTLVGNKLDLYYQKRIGEVSGKRTTQQQFLDEEAKKFRLLLADSLKPERRREIKEFLAEEGISADSLSKSMIFDLTIGALFGLAGAHLNLARGQTRNYLRPLLIRATIKMLGWTEKILTRSMRNSLTIPRGTPGAVNRWLSDMRDALHELVEALVE